MYISNGLITNRIAAIFQKPARVKKAMLHLSLVYLVLIREAFIIGSLYIIIVLEMF